MNSLLHIGADEGTIRELVAAICRILDYNRDREITLRALDVLIKGSSVSDVTICDCIFGSVKEG